LSYLSTISLYHWIAGVGYSRNCGLKKPGSD
jgi:hypothetical protein